jgi:hypothetical protein
MASKMSSATVQEIIFEYEKDIETDFIVSQTNQSDLDSIFIDEGSVKLTAEQQNLIMNCLPPFTYS